MGILFPKPKCHNYSNHVLWKFNYAFKQQQLILLIENEFYVKCFIQEKDLLGYNVNGKNMTKEDVLQNIVFF